MRKFLVCNNASLGDYSPIHGCPSPDAYCKTFTLEDESDEAKTRVREAARAHIKDTAYLISELLPIDASMSPLNKSEIDAIFWKNCIGLPNEEEEQ